VVSLSAGFAVAADLLSRTWPLRRLPLWDGAGNGWGAVELWSALSHGQLVDFLIRLNAQDKWPFGFSLLLMPFVAFGGGSFAAATLLPALAFALVPALLVWAALEVDRDGRGLCAGLLAGALWLVSATPRVLATIVMRETTGAALGVALLAAYLRARRLGTLGAWRLCGGLLLALFFTKYNYFLLGGAGVALHAWSELGAGARRALVARVRGRIVGGGWQAWERWAAIALALSAVALAIGQNPGNLLYAALVLGAGGSLFSKWRSLPSLLDRRKSWPPAGRALTELLLLPLWIWSLSPSPIHPKNVIAFLRNREGATFSPAALVYYPRAILASYLPGDAAAWCVALAALALTACLLSRRGDPARALATTVAVGALALEIHPLKAGRFLVTIAPFVFLAATLGGARLAVRLLPRARPLRLATGGALALLALYGILRLSLDSGALARLEGDHRLYTAGREYAAALDDLARRVAVGERAALLGGVNQLSEAAVRWRAAQRTGRSLHLVEPLRGLTGESPAERVRAKLAAWLGRGRPDRVVALVFAPGGARFADSDFLRFNAWQVEAQRWLEASDAWQARDRRRYPKLDFDLVTYERVRPGESGTRGRGREGPRLGSQRGERGEDPPPPARHRHLRRHRHPRH
jgi:hypothetical protein